jgi:tRNA threonylcarbamoyladenosine biosynthesis protein TsaB
MKVLAIDTATACGAVGLTENGRLIAELSLVSHETHSARLLPGVEWILKRVGWKIDEIDGFGVTLGPGSFTGLRVGLSTVKGFAWALKKPMVGLSSLEVLASQYRDEKVFIVPMLDARKERVYAASFRWENDRLETILPACDLPAAEFISGISGNVVLLGEGSRKYQSSIQALQRTDVTFAPLEFDLPRGATIARLTYEALLRGATLDIYQAEPTYLRASEAELKRREVPLSP